MTIQGGISTLQGVRYEVQAVLYEIPELIEGKIKTLRYQPLSSALLPNEEIKKIFTDDYSFADSKGIVHFCQAKHNYVNPDWTIRRLLREGVIQQFLQQHHQTPAGILRLVSNLPAQRLQNLAECAKRAISPAELIGSLNDQGTTDAKVIISEINVDESELWMMLQKVQCVHLTEESIDRMLTHYISDRYRDGEKFILVIKNFIENNPGRAITKSDIEEELGKKGLFILAKTSTKEIMRVFCEVSGGLRLYRSKIQGIHIERKETSVLYDWVISHSGDSPVALLLDSAGTGKSVIMHDLLRKFEDNDVPVLAIKADSLTNVSEETQLRTALNLPDTPEALLSSISKDAIAVLLIDQLDALSSTFARNQECLDLMIRLISRVTRIENIRIVVSCRDFDRRFDPKLRQMSCQEFRIKPLEQPEIEPVLKTINAKWGELTSREQQLLATPQHLLLYTDVVKEALSRGKSRESFSTVQDLYHELWNLKILNTKHCAANMQQLQNAIYVLVDNINATQVPIQPISVLGVCPSNN